MLAPCHRLRKEKDFENVFRKGEKVKGNFVYLKFAPNNLSESRFGIVVSKKVSLKAVERNKIKRKLREAIKELLPFAKTGFDVVLLVTPSFPVGRKGSYLPLVKSLFEKAHLLKG